MGLRHRKGSIRVVADAKAAQLSRFEPAALMWHHVLHPLLTLVAACLLHISRLHSAAAIVSCYHRGPMCHVADAKSVPSSPSDGCRSVLDYNMTVLSVSVSLRRVQGLASWQAPAVFCLYLPLLVYDIAP